MKNVIVPIGASKNSVDFIIYNVIASINGYFSLEELNEILNGKGIFLSSNDLKAKINDFMISGLLKTAYENGKRGLVYCWIR